MGRPSKPKPSQVTFLAVQKCPINDLHYDISNTRLVHKRFSSEKDAEKEIWLSSDMDYLSNDIQDRGLQEELIINNRLVVLEGNRRLAACKKLYEEQKKGNIKKKPFDFSSIQCKRFAPGTSPLDVDVFLASIHVAGKKEWPDYNQARLLYKLRHERHLSIDSLANITRKSKTTILKKYEAYELTEQYRKSHKNDKNWSEKYPHFIEFLRKDLEDFRQNAKNVDKFMSWLEDGNITNSLDIRHLKSVTDSPRALHVLEKNNISEAVKVVMLYDPTLKSPTYKKIVTITKLLKAFPTKEFLKTIEEGARLKLLRDLRNSADKLIIQIESVQRSKKRER